MPKDISIIVTHHTPVLAWLKPSPTSYRHENKKALQHFKQWVKKGFPHGQIKAIFPVAVGGETYDEAP